ncbi:MAG: APC family permease [Bryobacteraceae bacterium]
MSNSTEPQLIRGIGFFQATAANMLEMIGVGVFITIPLLLSKANGPVALFGWILGAIVALCDGMIWAELGAAMPGTGGSYHYLSEAYGPNRLGRLMSFLFIWQVIFLAPLSVATGAIGFAQYLKFLVHNISFWEEKVIGIAACALITILLYRDIRSVGRLSVIMWSVVLATLAWISIAGLMNFDPHRAFDFAPGSLAPSKTLFWSVGGATLIAMYDFGGYNNVCFFAGEVKRPAVTVPWSIITSVVVVATLYLTMNITIIGVVPWREAVLSSSIVSTFMERLYGLRAAQFATVLILWTTFGSLFALLLGYSRVPFAAAVEGRFFRNFARLHPTGRFPTFSLVFMGVCSALACFLNLEVLINALIVIQVLVQFIAQIIGLFLIRRYRPDIRRPFKMPLFYLTGSIALVGWLYILVASGLVYIVGGFALLIIGVVMYMWRAYRVGEWPFEHRRVLAA